MIHKAKFRLLSIISMLFLILGCNRTQQMMGLDAFDAAFLKMINPKSETDPDKYLLVGEWSKTGTPYLIKITGVFDIGKLEVGYYGAQKIEIEKANWAKTGTLLSVYIELQDPEYPGSNFKLNYIPERDVLVGRYYDAMEGMEYPVEFIRIK